MNKAATILGLLVAAAGCGEGPSAESAAASGGIDLAGVEFVDLSYGYGERTLYWPTDTEGFELESLAYGPSAGGYFYSSNRLSTAEHGGTHIDAPIHFAAAGWTVDQIPLERLVVPAAVIDISAQADADHDYRLTVGDIESWEAEHGQVAAGSALLVRSGWGRFWPDAKQYLGDDTPGDASHLRFPGFGADAARLLVDQRAVAMLGIDTASIDHGPTSDFPVHQIVGAANVAGLENVANLERLPPTGAWIVALPMKIEGGSGGPVRIVALLPRPLPR